jgi:putative restriction endonuclease
MHPDNVGLRLAMRRKIPLAWLFGVDKGKYLAVWPIFIVGDDRRRLTFLVEVDERWLALVDPDGESLTPVTVAESDTSEAEIDEGSARRWATTLAYRRLHQRSFRERVLRAYRECCAVCQLRHRALLEATHILPDRHPRGEPIVSNGIALCKLHHAAFDRHIMGIQPDLSIVIRPKVLKEKDGPMLIHGLQGFQGHRLTVPRPLRLRPNPAFLAERYEAFRQAG